MNRNETKIGKSHLPTSAVRSHLTSQKKNKHNNQTVPNPRTHLWWEFGLKMYMPWFSFLWWMRDEVLLSRPDTGSVLSHHPFLSVRKELGGQTPKFSLLLSLDLGWYGAFSYPDPGKYRQKLPFMLHRKGALIQHLMATENDTQRKKAGFFPNHPLSQGSFPSSPSVSPSTFLMYFLITSLNQSACRRRSSDTAAKAEKFYFGLIQGQNVN